MNASQTIKLSFSKSFTSLKSQKGLLYIVVIVFALAAFEAFNFGTTDYALTDLLGDLRFYWGSDGHRCYPSPFALSISPGLQNFLHRRLKRKKRGQPGICLAHGY